MDIIKFINSDSMACHFLNNFNMEEYDDISLRYAWLIWQSKRTSIKEKIEAWQEIIDTFPDDNLKKRGYSDGDLTLHKFLKEYIICIQTIVEKFLRREEDARYCNRVSWYEDDFGVVEEIECDHMFTLLAECVEDLWHYLEDSEDVLASYVEKNYENGDKIVIAIKCDKKTDGELNYELVSVEGFSGQVHTFDELNTIFKSMWFYFPIPFKAGDIVKLNFPKSEAFVVDSIYPKEGYTSSQGEYMPIYGYFTDWDGQIYYTGVNNYMDLTYYIDSLPGRKKILNYISEYLKGNIALDIVLSKYLVNYLKEQAKFVDRYGNNRTYNCK